MSVVLPPGFSVSDFGFIVYRATSEDIDQMWREYDEAELKGERMNDLTVYANKQSRLVGYLGEITFSRFIGDAAVRFRGKGPFDFVMRRTRHRVDVKCKHRTMPPVPSFDASMFAYQVKEDCDVYVFASSDFERVWICGWLFRTEFVAGEHSRLWETGEVDHSNGKVYHEDTWGTQYQYLRKFEVDGDGKDFQHSA